MADWQYPAELLEKLATFGLAPTRATEPTLVRDQLSDLYRYEIRRLRARLLAGEFPKSEYSTHVIALRRQYWPLSATPEQWVRICSGSHPHGDPEPVRSREKRRTASEDVEGD